MCSCKPGRTAAYSQVRYQEEPCVRAVRLGHGSTDSSTTIAPTFVSAVNDVRIVSHADFVLKGSGVQAGGSIFVDAQNVQLIAMQNTVYHYQMEENWGFYATAGSQQGSASVSRGLEG